MSNNLSACSVRALYQRYITEADSCSQGLLARMKEDPRPGVRKIYERINRNRDAAEAESARLDQMLVFERRLWFSGILNVAGVDEAGIGPLAGPVVAAAVIFPPETRISGVDDSKRLNPRQRSHLACEISREALSVSVGVSSVEEIDRLNVYQAGLLAMRRAVSELTVEPQHLLVDGRTLPGLTVPQERLVRGDQKSFAIAAASIIAKTRRDEIMEALDEEYPGYGFARHKGYGTADHRRALKQLGPAPPHRRSFTLLPKHSGWLFAE